GSDSAKLRRPARPQWAAAAWQRAADEGAAGAPAARALVSRVRPVLPPARRPAPLAGRRRAPGGRRDAARPARRVQPGEPPRADRPGDGPEAGTFWFQRRDVAAPAADGDGRIRPGAHQAVLPGAL